MSNPESPNVPDYSSIEIILSDENIAILKEKARKTNTPLANLYAAFLSVYLELSPDQIDYYNELKRGKTDK